MKIACLAWGSLVWDSKALPLRDPWKMNGPHLPIELARESCDGRITLVLVESAPSSPSLWARLDVESLEHAKEALARREGIPDSSIRYSIGFWCRENQKRNGRKADEIAAWAHALALDGVVWTNLKCGFRTTRGSMPSYAQVKGHLTGLDQKARSKAEEYVRRTPVQIATPYRMRLQVELGWIPIEPNKA